MCEICKPLLTCEVGKKVAVNLDQFDNKVSRKKMAMNIVRDVYKDHSKAFIHAEFIDEFGFWHNIAFNEVNFCPKCGAKL